MRGKELILPTFRSSELLDQLGHEPPNSASDSVPAVQDRCAECNATLKT